MRQLLFYSAFIALFFSCTGDKATIEKLSEITIRMDRDPGRINAFYSPTSRGRQVYQYIYLPLADYHPDDLSLSPILIESIPEGRLVEEDGNSYVVYDVRLKDEAAWSDGKPVLAKDYLFTCELVKHPSSKIMAWKPYFDFIKKVELKESDPKALSIYMDPDYMLSKETCLTSCVMPSHVYDTNDYIISRAYDIMKDGYEATDSNEIKIVEEVNNSLNWKKEIVQTGPYQITDFQSDEYIILDAIENYWGSGSDSPFFEQGSKRMIFRFVPDEVAAVNMATEGQIDVMSFRNSQKFVELKNDSSFNKSWSFHGPQIMQYYYIGMNNKSSLLASKALRNAMSHLADVDDYIQNIDEGLGTRTIGHFNPAKSYYNADLEPIPYDIEKAKRLLEDEGWKDSNGNGIRDKVIDGKSTELELDILITGSNLSKSIALLLQESAEKAGVKINVITKTIQLIRKENLSNYNYDMAALAITADAAPDDPYSAWHSDNAVPGKRNTSGYSNPEADRVIEQLRSTRDVASRDKLYKELQAIMYEDQPVIFLYSPLQKIIINKDLEAVTTSKRPGYLANTFKKAG